MGSIFGGGSQSAAPEPTPPPPRNIKVGSTPINRDKQRRRSSLANAPGQNRTLLTDDAVNTPLGA